LLTHLNKNNGNNICKVDLILSLLSWRSTT